MTQLEELEKNVINWAAEKGIFEKATPYKQAEKTLEECGELIHAVGQQELAVEYGLPTLKIEEAISDSIGDIAVTIIIQAKMQGLTLAECLQSAYDVIKNRTGKMVNGQFLKDK